MQLLLWLQEMRTPAVESFFALATYLGDQIAVVALLCLLLWCTDRKYALRLVFAFFLSGMTAQFVKLVFAVPRPWVLDPAIVPSARAVAGATGWSFPSGHTASAVALYGGLFLMYRRWYIRAACVFAVALVALSRLVLGVHTPMDVGASLLIGTALLAASWRMLEPDRKDGGKVILLGSCALITALLVAALLRSLMGDWGDEVHDALYAAGAGIGMLAGWRWMRGRELEAGERARALALKYLLGMLGIAAIKYITDFHWIATMAGYAMLALWAVALYPALWKKCIAPGKR